LLGEKHEARRKLRLIDIEPADLIALDRNELHGSAKIDAPLFQPEYPGKYRFA
jgi:hypothetical protein